MPDGGKKGRSVNSQAESKKHIDECGVEGNSEQPGLRARVQAGIEPKRWFRLQRVRKHKDGGSDSGCSRAPASLLIDAHL